MRKFVLIVILFLLRFSSYGQENIEWITHFGSPSIYYGVELGRKIESDSEGNIYVAGEFADIIRFGDIEWISNGNKDIFLVKLDSNGIVQWFKNFGGIEADWCGDICVNDNMDIYLSGTFRESIIIGDSIFTSPGGFPGYDFFITKINKEGDIIWAKASTGNGSNSVSSITEDKEGNIYLAGYYNHTISFCNEELLGPIGRSDLFVFKLDENGDFVWSKTTTSNANNFGNAIVSDHRGYLYLAGFMWDSVYFDNILLVSTGVAQSFLLRMDATTGNFLWAKGGGGNGWHEANSVIVDNSGDILINGWYRGDLVFEENIVTNGGNDNGPDDIYIAKFDSLGKNIWIKTARSNLYSDSYDIVTNEQNDIFLTGKFRGVLEIDNQSYYSSNSPYFDICVLKLTQDGDLEWFKSYGGDSPMNDIGYGIEYWEGSVIVTGMYSSNSYFDDNHLNCNGASDIFILKLSNTTESTIINSVINYNTFLDIIVYPNPASNNIFIEIYEDISTKYRVKVLDINGTTVIHKEISFSNFTEINTSTLKPGLYFLHVIDLTTKKFIIKKIIRK